ncbi:hypothetical protein F5887DRAFT_614491 [Amanita rubescens]|nr:hypothetical protein F5887DRAFT_614491 [Amanita rubescens]
MLGTMGREVPNGSLYFVTDCIKSVNWGIATFYAPSTAYDDLHLVFDETSCRWEFRGKVEAREGPRPMDVIVADGEEPNQCVFLRGYKIMLQQHIWDKLWNAVAVESQGGESSSPSIRDSQSHGTSGGRTDLSHQRSSDGGNTMHMDPTSRITTYQASQLTTHTPESWPGQVMLEAFCSAAAPVHPSDLINIMLLHLKPEAIVSLVHDSEWCDHLPDDFMADPINPNVDGLLENIKRARKVMVDEHGSVVLDNPEEDPEAQSLENLKPTTEEDYLRCRILIVGRSGVGKSSLINAIFKASLANVEHDRAGAANINKGITSPYNKHLILHDSQGYEPGDKEKFNILENFITEQTKKQSPTERLHAIWLCIPASYSGGRVFETGEENIFKLNRNKVPIVVVITKFDRYIAGLSKRGKLKGPNISQAAEQMFEQTFGHKFMKGGVSQDRPIPYALVSKSRSDTLQRLVQVTMEHIGAESSSLTSGLPGSDENQSGSAQIALATAQRVDMAGKIEASIKVGKGKYWRAIASSMVFLNVSLENCLYAIHKDIITIWNFRDLQEFLLSDSFRRRVTVIVEDLKDTNTMQSNVTVESALAGRSKLWTNAVHKNGPEHIRCFMGYVVDLTLILQAMFQVSLQDQYEGTVTVDHVDEILYEFHSSEKKKIIHNAIRTFAQHSRAKDDVVEKIQLLLKENQMTKADTQLNKNRPPLLSLLTILRFELTANGLVVNQIILGLVCELSKLPDFLSVVPGMDPLDVELLLDFILYLLQKDHLSTCGVPDANQKARRLMAKLISEANVIPHSLYITNVSFDAEHGHIGIGGHGRVLKGKYKEEVVALKMLDNVNKGQSVNFAMKL